MKKKLMDRLWDIEQKLSSAITDTNWLQNTRNLPWRASIRFFIRNTFQIFWRLYQMIRTVRTVCWETWWHKWKYELLINQLRSTNTAITRTWSRYIVMLLLLLCIILLLIIDWQIWFYWMLLRVNVSILIVIVMMIVANHCRIVVVAIICGYEFSFLIRCTANWKNIKEKWMKK